MRTRKSAGTRISFLACPFLAKGQSGFSSRYGRLRLWLVKERRNIRKNVCEEYTKGIYEIKSCDECLVYSYHSKWTILATGVNRVHRAWSVEKNHPSFSNYFNYKDELIWRVYSVSSVP